MKKYKYLIFILAVIVAMFMTVVPVYADETEKVVLSLDTELAEVGSLPNTITMTISTSEPIVPIQLSAEAYSSNESIKIVEIIDGDKELCSSTKTGRFAWLGANNEKEVTEFAKIVFEIPKDLETGTYTFGVRYASATDKNGNEILISSEQSVTFTVTNAVNATHRDTFNVFNNFFSRWTFFGFRWF